ncbi:hypothetical protein KC333_g1, partial [Hortaea werneckii]
SPDNHPNPTTTPNSNPQPIRLGIKATNLTHYALSAAPAGAEHLRQTLGYAPARGCEWTGDRDRDRDREGGRRGGGW